MQLFLKTRRKQKIIFEFDSQFLSNPRTLTIEDFYQVSSFAKFSPDNRNKQWLDQLTVLIDKTQRYLNKNCLDSLLNLIILSPQLQKLFFNYANNPREHNQPDGTKALPAFFKHYSWEQIKNIVEGKPCL